MSRNYIPIAIGIHKPEAVYFVSFAVVEWLDVFTRNEYKNLLLDSLSFCQKEKGMEIYAWCIMTTRSAGFVILRNLTCCFVVPIVIGMESTFNKFYIVLQRAPKCKTYYKKEQQLLLNFNS
ncbi:MAG: hypothetical protein ACWA41_01800 [Putridiphycobacter sp.]